MKTFTLVATFLLASFALTGCNTIEGVGEDLEQGGEKIQEAADRHNDE